MSPQKITWGGRITLVALIVTFVLVTCSLALSLRYELKTSAFDGAAYAQLFFNLMNGNGLTGTIVPPYVEQHWLGFHFSPILYLVYPLFVLFPSIDTLLILQSILFALAAIPIYMIAQIQLKNGLYGVLFALLYLTNPFLFNAAVWDFHEIAFAPVLMALGCLAVVKRQFFSLCIICLLLVATKEHYGLCVSGFGVLWGCVWREWRKAATLIIAGILALVIVLAIVMPFFSPLDAPSMLHKGSDVDRFSWIFSAHHNLPFLLNHIYVGLFYGLMLLIFSAFQPLLAISWLFPGAADVAANILSNNQMMRSIYSYHSAPLVPLLVISMIMALQKKLSKLAPKKQKKYPIYLLGMVSLTLPFLAFPGLAVSIIPNYWEINSLRLHASPEDREALTAIHDIVGNHSAISVQNNIVPHMSPRQHIYHFPDRTQGADYIIINLDYRYKKTYGAMGTPLSVSIQQYIDSLSAVAGDNRWGIIYDNNRWFVFKRGASFNAERYNRLLQKINIFHNETRSLKK